MAGQGKGPGPGTGNGHPLLLERRPSGKRYLGLHLLLFAAGGVLIAAALLAWLAAVPAVVLVAAGVLLPLAGLVYAWLATRATTYDDITPGAVGLVVDSYGLWSVCLARRSAADELRLGAGDLVTLTSVGDAPVPPASVTLRSRR